MIAARRKGGNLLERGRRPPPAVKAALSEQKALLRAFDECEHQHILDRGTGACVVFIPTFTELSFVYAPLINELSELWRTILYLPQTSPIAQFGPRERAAELRRILRTVGVREAHIVAGSDAGAVATQFASEWPEMVSSRTYIGTAGRYRMPVGLRLLSRLYTHSSVHKIVPDAWAATLIAAIMGSHEMPSRHLYRPIRALGPVAGYLRYSILPCLEWVNDVVTSSPSLVIGSDQDRLVSLAQSLELARYLGAKHIAVDGGDHFLPWTASRIVNSAVGQFLRDCEAHSTA
jgi:pimeloyl-ACP methyl ester carboxylesterase